MALTTSRRRSKTLAWILVCILAPVIAIALTAWYLLYREEPQRLEMPPAISSANVDQAHIAEAQPIRYATPDDPEYPELLFKYGSIGNEEPEGFPYWIWMVLPRVFPQHLPGDGGWTSLGLYSERGYDVPVGFSRRTIGFPRIAINCAFCHTASFRRHDEDVPELFAGGPSHQLDVQGYQRFLFACANDPMFNADVLLAAISQNVQLTFVERLLYRYGIIPQTKAALLDTESRFAWMSVRPAWLRGRIDPFNPVKFGILTPKEERDDDDLEKDGTIGNSDNVAVWNLRAREDAGFRFHWDGMNTDIDEVVHSSALGDGSTIDSINLENLEVMKEWLRDRQPPSYLFLDEREARGESIDSSERPNFELSSFGREVFEAHCARCHAGQAAGRVVAQSEVGTDIERHKLWTAKYAQRYNDFTDGKPWDFDDFRSTDGDEEGYVSGFLDGIWLRAPYLHNGSAPTLTDLLAKPYNAEDARELLLDLPADLETLPLKNLAPFEEAIGKLIKKARSEGRRPPVFFRGDDVYDTEHVGFLANRHRPPKIPRYFSVYDTRQRANSTAGHLYGTDLTPEEKRALIEYLKTL